MPRPGIRVKRMYIEGNTDLDELLKALKIILDRDIRAGGERIPERTPAIAKTVAFVLEHREIFEQNLTNGCEP